MAKAKKTTPVKNDKTCKKERLKSFEEKLEAIKTRLTKDRDDLYDLIDEHRRILEDCGEALNYLDAAVEELSGEL